MTYKGYAANIQYDAEDHIFVGRLAGITDIVTFHGESVTEFGSGIPSGCRSFR